MASRKPNMGRYITIPNQCLISKNFASLSPHANKLFMDFASKYTGFNNGDLNMVWSEAIKRGWKSKATLYSARDELVQKGWIVQTRQGWNNRCSLYGFTFLKMGEFIGKLECRNGSLPTNEWQGDEWKSRQP